MFEVGDVVMHPAEGICRIEEIRTLAFSGAAREYYVLRPRDDKNSDTVYLPVDRGNQTLRRLLSYEDIPRIIRESAGKECPWAADAKRRREVFAQTIASGDYARMLCMIGEIRRREENGERIVLSDKKAMEAAEMLVQQEFSFVLGMTVPQTAAFIEEQLRK